MRLLYDLRWMELGRAGGVEQATYELIDAIAHRDRTNGYAVFAPRSACWEWEFPAQFDVRRHYSDPADPSSSRFHSFVATKRAGETRDGGEFGFDVVHSTCSYIHPEMLDFPGILTIQDLQHLHHPEFFTASEIEDRERLYRESARRAVHVICSSEFTRHDVHERYGVPLQKMTTVWNIPSRAPSLPAAMEQRLVRRLGIDGPFLLYPAQAWPHKNHARLLEALREADAALPPGLRLVMTGAPYAPGHPAAGLLREPRVATRAVHLGFRSPLEMHALLRQCAALVFPSLFEGFGMPVAEAILAGRPIACSDVTSLPEIAGNAALRFDPRDVGDIARALVTIATRADLREALAAASLARRPLFSAHRRALETLAVYERVFASVRRRGS